MKTILLFFSLLTLTPTAQTKTGDSSNGKRLFMRNGCYQCHGTVGQGGLAGPRLAQTKLTLPAFTATIGSQVTQALLGLLLRVRARENTRRPVAGNEPEE